MKTLESIRDEIWEEMLRLEDKRIDQWADIKYQTLREVLQKLGHLDEPEVLSQEWIDEHVDYADVRGGTQAFIHVDDLQNLLVPKQEELESKIKVLIEAYKKEDGAYSNPENAWIDGFITDLEYLLEEEQKYLLKHNGEYLKSVQVETYYNRESLDELGIHLSYTAKGLAQIFTKEQKEYIEKHLNVEAEEVEE